MKSKELVFSFPTVVENQVTNQLEYGPVKYASIHNGTTKVGYDTSNPKVLSYLKWVKETFTDLKQWEKIKTEVKQWKKQKK